MNSAELIFTHSPWWIAIAILAGIIYAMLLYSKKGPWSETVKKILFALRAVAIALIVLLLINPMLRRSVNTTVKPTAVLLFDNSTSIPSSIGTERTQEAISQLKELQADLTDQGYQVKIHTLEGETASLDSIRSVYETSDVTRSLSALTEQYDPRDLAYTILVTDGIYNQGISPDFRSFSQPVYTIGIGDTIPKKDIILKNLRYNKIAYLDNQFPIEAEILQNGFSGTTASVNLRKNGRIIQTTPITFSQNRSFQTLDFTVSADQPGLNRFTIEIDRQPGEQSTINNSKDIYIDVIDNKDKILILASSPHPDIKAIKSVLEQNKNYEVYDFIAGIGEYKEEDYNLVISHQPFSGNSQADRILNQLVDKKTPVWYILGKNTNLAGFNSFNTTIEIDQSRGQFDNVSGALNSDFNKFTSENIGNNVLAEWPPLDVPYGNTRLKAPSEILLYQKIGSITSDRPLLIINNNTENKEAVMLASGLWKWRILEASRFDETATFSSIFGKLIQYLNTKEDKRRFRVTTSETEYSDSENVVFNTDVYNEIYEKIYNIPVELKLTDESGQSKTFSYVTSRGDGGYRIGGLEPGAYKYTASATLNGKRNTVAGGFSVIRQQIEAVSLTADFDLLRRLSSKTGGEFSTIENLNRLRTSLSTREATGVIYSEEDYSQLVELRWLLILIAGLFSAEWFIRKFSGGY